MTNSRAKKMKILIVDDHPDILEFLQYNLELAQFEVISAQNGLDAIKAAHQHMPEIILLDYMMPDKNGLEVCAHLRQNPKLNKSHIIFLTAKEEEENQINAFKFGADDFFFKPLKIKVLLSKLNSLRTKLNNDYHSKVILIGDLNLDSNSFTAYKNGEKLNLPKKEFKLLFLMASQPGKVFNREELLSKIWDENTDVGPRTIDVHVKKIRSKVGSQYIRTLKGIGYKFVGV